MQLQRSQSLHDRLPFADLYQRYWLMILTDVLSHVPSQQDAPGYFISPSLLHEAQYNESRNPPRWMRRVFTYILHRDKR